MNKFQRKVISKVKEFENNTNNFNIMMEMDDNMVQLNDGYHVIDANKNCLYFPKSQVFRAARIAVKENKSIFNCFTDLKIFKVDLQKLGIEIAEEECGCSHSCGNCKNCSCHDELTITQEGEVNE